MTKFRDILDSFASLAESHSEVEFEREDLGNGIEVAHHVVMFHGKVFEVCSTPEEARKIGSSLSRYVSARKIAKDMIGEDTKDGKGRILTYGDTSTALRKNGMIEEADHVDSLVHEDANQRIEYAKSSTLKALESASEDLGSLLLNLNAARNNVTLIDKSSNAPNDKMLQSKIEQAYKMTQKLDSFVNQLSTFIEDIKI